MSDTDSGLNVLVTGSCGYSRSALIPYLLEYQPVGEGDGTDSLVGNSPRNLAGCLGNNSRFFRGDVKVYGDVQRTRMGANRAIHSERMDRKERGMIET